MRVARATSLKPEQRSVLEQQARSRSVPARVVERARIILRATDRLKDKDTCRRVGDSSRDRGALAQSIP
jgi:hypothetical protein